ncbi:helix-turn-helix domain-containing protein [Devosia honganensis]|uniref:Helix-turn-helix domain-containing protein n=1 Tax=Devosia honganensis TaxID=1610527 RepID=A0ABV7X3B5_9HYPH
MTKRDLGKHYIREWREYRGLSLRKFADRLEAEPGVPLMSHANIGRIETGQQPYDQEFLEAAAVALGTTVTDLLTTNPLIDDAVAKLTAILRAATGPEQEMALRVVREMLGKADKAS